MKKQKNNERLKIKNTESVKCSSLLFQLLQKLLWLVLSCTIFLIHSPIFQENIPISVCYCNMTKKISQYYIEDKLDCYAVTIKRT
jgi:hypothetical protein